MGAINVSLITCPDDCTDVNLLPAIPEDQVCTSYEQTLSQVSDLFIIPYVAADIFSDFGTDDAANVTDTIYNADTTNAYAKWLVGIGGVAEPEATIDEYPKLQRKISERLYTLTFRVLNLVQAQYDFLRMLQCGDTSITFYYRDLGGYTYGVRGGLMPESVDVDFPMGEGNDDKSVGIITLKWYAAGDPDRCTIGAFTQYTP